MATHSGAVWVRPRLANGTWKPPVPGGEDRKQCRAEEKPPTPTPMSPSPHSQGHSEGRRHFPGPPGGLRAGLRVLGPWSFGLGFCLLSLLLTLGPRLQASSAQPWRPAGPCPCPLRSHLRSDSGAGTAQPLPRHGTGGGSWAKEQSAGWLSRYCRVSREQRPAARQADGVLSATAFLVGHIRKKGPHPGYHEGNTEMSPARQETRGERPSDKDG